MWRVDILNHSAWGPWAQRINRRPSWAWQLALAAGVLVIVGPLVLLILTAILVAAAVFIVASLVAAGLNLLQRLLHTLTGHSLPHDDGRRNVRVIHRI